MANSTKSSKAKPKTKPSKRTAGSEGAKTLSTKSAAAKRPASRRAAAKRTGAAGNKTDRVANKAATTSRFNSFKPSRDVTLQTLRGLHFITVGILILLAIAAGYLMKNTSFQLTLGHMAKDELMSTTKTVLAPAVQSVSGVELRWVVVGTMLVSAILPILYLTKLVDRYALYLNRTRMLPLRWVDLAVTGSLVVGTAALVNGVSDLPTLALLAGLMIAMALSGLIAERQNNEARTPVRSAYAAALFAGIIPPLFIVVYLFATASYGMVRLPWYTVALFAVVGLQYIGWTANLKAHLRSGKNIAAERNYLMLSLAVKAAFAIVLIVALHK